VAFCGEKVFSMALWRNRPQKARPHHRHRALKSTSCEVSSLIAVTDLLSQFAAFRIPNYW
jgi:hypothetical protein